eukprot:gene42174-52288_t
MRLTLLADDEEPLAGRFGHAFPDHLEDGFGKLLRVAPVAARARVDRDRQRVPVHHKGRELHQPGKIVLRRGVCHRRRGLGGRRHRPEPQRQAQAAANGKPVIALKVGKSEYGQKAAQSHTASLTGSAEVNSAVFKQCGVIEVDDIDELVDTAWLFARGEPAPSEGVAIYTSSGGTAALTADAVGTSGLTLAQFAPHTRQALADLLPAFAALDNPVDTTAAVLSDAALIEKSLSAVAVDPNLSCVIAPIALDYGDTTIQLARTIIAAQKGCATPIIPIWMSDRMGEGYRMLVEGGFAPPRSVGKGIKAIQRWIEYGRWKRARVAHTPLNPVAALAPAKATRSLSEAEAKCQLKAAGIQLLPNALAPT